MTFPAVAVEERKPKRDLWAMVVLYLPIIGVTIVSKIAFNMGGKEIWIGIPAIIGATLLGMFSGRLRLEPRRFMMYLGVSALLVAEQAFAVHAFSDTSLILHSLTDTARDRTVVAAAADYWFKHPLLGNVVSLFLNTFPFSRTGGAQAQLHSSSNLLKSGWNLVLFPEGSRSPDGRIQEFKPGVGHLARETGTPVVPVHIQGAFQVMPRHQPLPLPGKVRET